MTRHLLRIHYSYRKQIQDWTKTFEIRKNDRNYQIWDTILFWCIDLDDWGFLMEIKESLEITDVFDDYRFWLKKWYCILSFKKI